MADTDTIDVTFARQAVFHDGTSMIVAKEGDTLPLARSRVARFIDEGTIEEPEGWAEEVAAKNDLAVADGFQREPASAAPGTDEPTPGSPVSLTNKSKAQLIQIAADEGVAVDETWTNRQITEAIEAERAAGENAPPA